ncbi:hypothetical protein BD410DRAFT_721682 [Rickenella mellea]|uniref:CwfJ C-terminus 1-domain-containing protein-like protein n=1 Tax=Rickenella mellea TaxID=50990 RepID=A0A4Y7Q6A0_9AGAM|nr:hypothetical protein BD410DRAFT_721682 [Rickenella mellea]
MGGDTDRPSSKHKKSRTKDSDTSSKKRHRRDDGQHRESKKKHKSQTHDSLKVIDDDPDDDVWVEKNIDMDGEHPLATDIPTAESLKLKSRATILSSDPDLPPNLPTESKLSRDEWMLEPASAASANSGPSVRRVNLPTGEESLTEEYGEPAENVRTMDGGVDFFSGLGTERKKKKKDDRPDPEKPEISSKELNTQLVQGKTVDEYTPSAPKSFTPGGPGSQWRMMKLRRVYETAEEEGKGVEEVALDRYGSLDAFYEAQDERRLMDEREGRKAERGRPRENQKNMRDNDGEQGETRWMFSDVGGSGSTSRSSSFRRPGASAPSTPSPAPQTAPPMNKRLDSLRLPSDVGKSPLSQSHTPIPSVMTPQMPSTRRLSPSSLNKMQANVLRAKLMGRPDAEKLEEEYENERRKAEAGYGADPGQSKTRVEVLPTLDVQGRLYDVGTGMADGNEPLPGNRRKNEKFETRDSKTGDIIRYNKDDDEVTLGEMLRQEKFSAGMADQKNLDMELAKAIMGDGKFEDDLEYMDDNAERLGRKKMRSDGMKRQFAINDYKKTQKALAACQFCFGEDDSPPKAPMIAMATRCYLSCTLNQELTSGHCLIVPIQHHLTMLEGDDDVWDEVRNFMKCLMRMFAEEDKGVVFYETVINIKWQKHTFIECVPLPWDQFEDVPQYFKESILSSETEWTQHKKLIDFSARPGGFRRAMVPNLPYFMVQFDHKGEKGYGHVIEGTSEAAGGGEEDGAIDEGEKGGGDFPSYFAAEIIGNMLEVEPRRWRRPKRIDYRHNKERVAEFKKKYEKFDWTSMIGKG